MTLRVALNQEKNANIHFFIYKKKFFLFWDQGITKDQSTLLHVSWRVTCKEQLCGKSTRAHLTIANTQLRVEDVPARGRRAPFEYLQRSRDVAPACTAGLILVRLWQSCPRQKPPIPLPSSLLDNGDRLLGNPELLRESQHCSTLVHVFCERKFFLARQIWYTEPTSQTNFLLVLKKKKISLQC